MRKSNPTFLKRQKELARQQRKQEKQQRLAQHREHKGPEIANESDMLGLGLDPQRLAGAAVPKTPSSSDTGSEGS